MIVGVALSIVAAAVPTALYTWLVWWCDRYEREPLRLLAAAFLWGAVPAILLSLIVELVLHVPLSALRSDIARDVISSGIVAPLVEEPVKALALLGLFLWARQEFDGVLDGIVYGALVGFGFAMTENVFYFVSVLQEKGWGVWVLVVFLRSVIFGFNHAFFTSIVGIGLGVARMTRHRWARWAIPALALMGAIGFHFVHNVGAALAELNCLSVGISLLADWGGVWIVVAIIVLARRQERRWIWEYLADEGIPESDRRAAVSARGWGRIPASARGRDPDRAPTSREYYQLLAELALRKHRLARLGDEPGLQQEIVQLRSRIWEMRNARADAM